MKTRRFWARVIDSVLTSFCCLLLYWIAFLFTAVLPNTWVLSAIQASTAYLYPVFAFLFIPVTEAWRGRTFGKQIMGARVYFERNGEYEDIEGNYLASVARNITLIIPFVNFADILCMFMRSDGRRLGDLIANTRVTVDPRAK